jgi:tetratricopeptide (TPR) repeat protein
MKPAAILVVLSGAIATGSADDLEPGTTWDAVRREASSVVFGRLEGRFDGTEYRGRKIRVRERTSGAELAISVEQGLGYFEAVLPVGTYEILSIEATYFPPIKPMNPRRYVPIPQRYALNAIETGRLPSFPAVTEMPVYLGTIRSTIGVQGIVYEGHELQIVDEYEDAWRRFRERHPALAASLLERRVDPARYFFLKPAPPASPLELDSGADPLARARTYIAEGKYRQAIDWLGTAVAVSDAERVELRLLEGEALLADKKYIEAIEELGDALLADPENLRALRLLARAHALEGNAEDALNLYQALARYVPDDAEASLHIGYRYALRSESELATEAFDAAFESNFDYLLHDLTPYAMALKAEGSVFEPPQALDGFVRVPSNLQSRRSARGGFGLLLDHKGKVLAAHLTPDAETWALVNLMSIVRARFRPAKLNGVPIPCLLILGAQDVIEADR